MSSANAYEDWEMSSVWIVGNRVAVYDSLTRYVGKIVGFEGDIVLVHCTATGKGKIAGTLERRFHRKQCRRLK